MRNLFDLFCCLSLSVIESEKLESWVLEIAIIELILLAFLYIDNVYLWKAIGKILKQVEDESAPRL